MLLRTESIQAEPRANRSWFTSCGQGLYSVSPTNGNNLPKTLRVPAINKPSASCSAGGSTSDGGTQTLLTNEAHRIGWWSIGAQCSVARLVRSRRGCITYVTMLSSPQSPGSLRNILKPLAKAPCTEQTRGDARRVGWVMTGTETLLFRGAPESSAECDPNAYGVRGEERLPTVRTEP